MEGHLKVIIDTDILIKAYRDDSIKIKNLKLLKNAYCISVMSAIELIAGAKNIQQYASFNKVLKVYPVIHVEEAISKRTFTIFKEYVLTTVQNYLIV